jgi:tRNA(Ile)-lysidine synthase
MRFFRGTGIKGLGGILPVRDNIIRPLLCVKRAEIEEYCHKKGILYRTDATNLVEDYTRNKIRLSLIPQIEESFNKSVTETMFRTAQLISDENAYIEKTAEDAYNDCLCGENKISIEKLMKYDKVIRRRIVRKGFVNYSVDLHDIAFDHVEAVLSLTDKKSGSEIRLPNGLFAVREFDSIAFKKKNGETKGFCFDIHTDEEVFLPTCGIKILLTKDRKNEGLKNKGLKNEGFEKEKFTEICLDADKFDVEKAVIRTRQTGDKIYLKGINGNKSIKKLFTEYKIPSAQRDEIPMLAIGSDIVWVKDMKTSGRYKAEEDTENVIYLYVRR